MEIRLSLSVPEPPATVWRALTDPAMQPAWMPSLASSHLLSGTPGETGAQYGWTVAQARAQPPLGLGEMAPVERRMVGLLAEAEVRADEERIYFQIAGPQQSWIEVAYDLAATDDGGTLVDVWAAGETADVLALLPRLAPEPARGAALRDAARREPTALRLASLDDEPVVVDASDEVVVLGRAA
jgi:carbon monoxide dehydrogenase subunit G